VFGGMLAASAIGIFLITVLYVVLRTLQEKTMGAGKKQRAAKPVRNCPVR
jgi:hypothetical protein